MIEAQPRAVYRARAVLVVASAVTVPFAGALVALWLTTPHQLALRWELTIVFVTLPALLWWAAVRGRTVLEPDGLRLYFMIRSRFVPWSQLRAVWLSRPQRQVNLVLTSGTVAAPGIAVGFRATQLARAEGVVAGIERAWQAAPDASPPNVTGVFLAGRSGLQPQSFQFSLGPAVLPLMFVGWFFLNFDETHGWLPLALGLVGFAMVLTLAIPAVLIEPDGVRIRTLRGSAVVAWTDLESVRARHGRLELRAAGGTVVSWAPRDWAFLGPGRRRSRRYLNRAVRDVKRAWRSATAPPRG